MGLRNVTKPFCASKASQCKSPSGAKDDSPGQARRSKRRPGYRCPHNYLPRPFRGEGWGEGSVCSVHELVVGQRRFAGAELFEAIRG